MRTALQHYHSRRIRRAVAAGVRAPQPVNSRSCYVCSGVDEQAADGMWQCSNCNATHGPTPLPLKLQEATK